MECCCAAAAVVAVQSKIAESRQSGIQMFQDTQPGCLRCQVPACNLQQHTRLINCFMQSHNITLMSAAWLYVCDVSKHSRGISTAASQSRHD